MKTTDSQIVIEKKFLITILIVTFLVVVGIIIVAVNWDNWFGKDVPLTPGTSQNGNLELTRVPATGTASSSPIKPKINRRLASKFPAIRPLHCRRIKRL